VNFQSFAWGNVITLHLEQIQIQANSAEAEEKAIHQKEAPANTLKERSQAGRLDCGGGFVAVLPHED
jgi:hypothetical protein